MATKILPAARILMLSTVVLMSLTAAAIAAAQGHDSVCGSCGAMLPGKALYCPQCGQPVAQPETIYCWRCGAALPADARYCAACGSEVCSARPVPTPAAPLEPAAPAPAPATAPPTPALESPAQVPQPSEPARKSSGLAEFLRERQLVLPPRVITSPTGTILPSMTLHVGGGWAFGFSEREHSGGWLVSFGLGGVGEAMIASARILHALDMESHALAGFRVGLPVSLIDRGLSKKLAVALNVAATGENDYYADGVVPAGAGSTVRMLTYDHRETTLGIAATWRAGRLGLHGALHGTDLRTTNVSYSTEGSGYGSLDEQRITYTTLGLGFDFNIDERIFAMAEVHSVPRISLAQAEGELRAGTLTEYAAGLRFYPTPVLGLDATAAVDEEAVGLADVEIGFGLHFTIGPRASGQ